MYQLAKHLTHPYFLFVLILGTALVWSWWKKGPQSRWRLLALTLPYLALVVVSLPALAFVAVGSLEWRYPVLNEMPADAQAIVVLSGGQYSSFYRCQRAAELYRAGHPRPVLMSCGPDYTTQNEGDRLRAHLLRSGVRAQDLLEERQSANTYENAVHTHEILTKRSIRRIVLVTDAMHLPRAVACFEKQGFEVIPAGCAYETEGGFSNELFDYLPDSRAIAHIDYACQEWLGMAWYRMCGRI